MVTGDMSPVKALTNERSNPRPGLASPARQTTVWNFSSRSIVELILLRELLRLGGNDVMIPWVEVTRIGNRVVLGRVRVVR